MSKLEDLAHFVVLYRVNSDSMIAEIDGPNVFQFGLFGDETKPTEMISTIFPDLPVVALPDQGMLDDQAVLILGNSARQSSLIAPAL